MTGVQTCALPIYDAQVAYECLALGDIDRAQTYAITARTAADAAETMLRVALDDASSLAADQ